jgi:Long-chain acyl-CoA synthetases (AMP-forming)
MVVVNNKPLSNVSLSLSPKNELLVRSNTLCHGYYPDMPIPQESYPTRDLAEIAANGSVKILGRKDLMIITGGENVDP